MSAGPPGNILPHPPRMSGELSHHLLGLGALTPPAPRSGAHARSSRLWLVHTDDSAWPSQA